MKREPVIIRPFFRVLAGLMGFPLLLMGLVLFIGQLLTDHHVNWMGVWCVVSAEYPLELSLTGGTRAGRKRLLRYLRPVNLRRRLIGSYHIYREWTAGTW